MYRGWTRLVRVGREVDKRYILIYSVIYLGPINYEVLRDARSTVLLSRIYNVLLVLTPIISRGKASPSRRIIATKSSARLPSDEDSGSSALE
jgi:hypothetical protein